MLSELLERSDEKTAQKAAFDRCIDVMTRMLMKYGPAILDQWEREEKNNTKIKVPVSLQAKKNVLY